MTTAMKGELVIQRLESLFGQVRFNDDFWRERKEPFWLIVDTILSQNTSNANSGAALRNMLIKYKTIEDVFLANVQDIAHEIRQAGLYEAKARSISSVANEIMETYGGDTWSFIGGSYNLREHGSRKSWALGQKQRMWSFFLPVILNHPRRHTLFRVSRRIGLAPQKGGYEVVKTALEDGIPRGKRKFAM